MDNEQAKKHIKAVTKIVGDNGLWQQDGRRPDSIVFSAWGAEEIDNVPKNFNWQEFWRDCKKEYPLHSVSGSARSESDIVLYERFSVPIIKFNNNIKERMIVHPRVLEIGYGFGGAAKNFIENCYDYTGIDYVSSFSSRPEQGNFIEIRKSGIPKKILSQGETFDIVYSTNVFQHLTNKQRLEYYRQAYSVLTRGGMFYFDIFTRNAREFRRRYSVKEERELAYAANFFGLHTSVPYKTKVIKDLSDCGFHIVEVEKLRVLGDPRTNWVAFTAVKK